MTLDSTGTAARTDRLSFLRLRTVPAPNRTGRSRIDGRPAPEAVPMQVAELAADGLRAGAAALGPNEDRDAGPGPSSAAEPGPHMPATPPPRFVPMPVQRVEMPRPADLARALCDGLGRACRWRLAGAPATADRRPGSPHAGHPWPASAVPQEPSVARRDEGGDRGGQGRTLAARFRAIAATLAFRRWLYLVLVAATSAAASVGLWTLLRIDGVLPVEATFIVLFTVLFAWIASSFWLACFGAYARLFGAPLDSLRPPTASDPDPPRHPARTAVVMPVYNEDVAATFGRLAAICESVREAGALGVFDFYILSDSTAPACRAEEEERLRRLRSVLGDEVRLFYRHRADNKGRKSGNIAEFCENWGNLYDYMVVLDADSLMAGRTLVEMVRLMDANPKAALIQVPPQIVGRDSLFARMQQFASSVYGTVYTAGLAWLQGADGNYWGHNAIIRVRPFMQHCGLPELPGRPPLGGEIMSHDFVEAALLRRAGWELWLAPDLGGSYEEAPPTVLDHLARDRRWCQGNLQHLKLILARGLRLPSRLHLAAGVMSYLCSPLWLLLLVLTAIEAHVLGQLAPVTYNGAQPVLAWPFPEGDTVVFLMTATAVLLLGPKVLAFLLLTRDTARLRAHGGAVRAGLSVALESLHSILFAPVAMLSHSWFVLNILLGRSAAWSCQKRDDHRPSLGAVTRVFSPHTFVALAAGVAAFLWIPGSVWWLSPVWIPAALSIPLVWIVSDPEAGRGARSRNLFLIESETVGIPVIARAAAMVAADGQGRLTESQAGAGDQGADGGTSEPGRVSHAY